MDFIVTYGIMTMDVLLLLAFFYIIFKNLPIKRIAGAVKGILFVVVLWFVSRLLNFHMAEAVLGQIIQYGFLAVIILFPNEFRKLLENIGRRRVFSWNTGRLIELESRRELATAVVNLAKKKNGAVIVIAREDNLDVESATGNYVGEMEIKSEFIEMMFSKESPLRNGALIIKDDAIVSANARLPLAENRQLEDAGAGKRHLAGLGVVAKRDCMSIVVSADTGYITIIGYIGEKVEIDFAMPLREYDLHDGIDEDFIVQRIEDYLQGKSHGEEEEESGISKWERKVKGKVRGKGKSGKESMGKGKGRRRESEPKSKKTTRGRERPLSKKQQRKEQQRIQDEEDLAILEKYRKPIKADEVEIHSMDEYDEGGREVPEREREHKRVRRGRR